MYSETFDIDIPTLRAALDAVEERFPYPTARLARNQVGNIAVMVQDEYVGWIDLDSGEFTLVVERLDLVD